MKIYHHLSEYQKGGKAIITVGTFDGVHVGHQRLLDRIGELAKTEGGESVLLTFSPHPRLVLFPEDNDLKLITTMEERIERLSTTGLQNLIIHPFTSDFSRTTAQEYVKDILVRKLGVHKLVIGYDHHFGRNREGNLENLKELAPKHGFMVEEIPAQEIDDVNVSSTKIRTALEEGSIKLANEYLGYNFTLSGSVGKGDALGRELGFPTANIEGIDPYKLIPANGVYATYVEVQGVRYQGMTNIGVRPTINDSGERRVEVHLLNYSGDLYGETIRLEFIRKLRNELKFEDVEALRNQLHRDAETVEHIFHPGHSDR